MSKLENCPFCGGKATDWEKAGIEKENLHGFGWLGCQRCHIFINYKDNPTGRRLAEEHWNTRKPIDDALAELEGLQEVNAYDDDDISVARYGAYENAISILRKAVEHESDIYEKAKAYNESLLQDLLEAKQHCREDSDCSKCIFGQIADRCILDELQKETKAYNDGWIPCKERLLDNYIDAWVTVKNRDGFCYVTRGYYNIDFAEWCTHRNVTVIAWKPYEVPQPYKEESGKVKAVNAKFCCNCKHWQWSEMMQENQCWCANCIHEGEERDDFQSACGKFEEEGGEE